MDAWVSQCFCGLLFATVATFPESQAAVRTTTYVSEEVCAPGFSTLAALYARDTVPAGGLYTGTGKYCTNPLANGSPSAQSPGHCFRSPYKPPPGHALQCAQPGFVCWRPRCRGTLYTGSLGAGGFVYQTARRYHPRVPSIQKPIVFSKRYLVQPLKGIPDNVSGSVGGP